MQLIELINYDPPKIQIMPKQDFDELIILLEYYGHKTIVQSFQKMENNQVIVTLKADRIIGSLVFSNYRLVILPKNTDHSKLILDTLLLTKGYENFTYEIRADQIADNANVLDLLFIILMKQISVLLQRGIIKQFVAIHERTMKLRGRIILRESLMSRSHRPKTLLCQYDELSFNIIENRIILSVLEQGIQLLNIQTITKELKRLQRIFKSYCEPILFPDPDFQKNIQYSNANNHYQPVHETISLLIKHFSIMDYSQLGKGKNNFTWFIDISNLWEDILFMFFDKVSSHLGLYSRKQQKVFIESDNIEFGMSSKIDILISHSDDETKNALIVDAKYKKLLKNSIKSADLYQMIAYTRLFQEPPYRAILVYPMDDYSKEILQFDKIIINRIDEKIAITLHLWRINWQYLIMTFHGKDDHKLIDHVNKMISQLTSL